MATKLFLRGLIDWKFSVTLTEMERHGGSKRTQHKWGQLVSGIKEYLKTKLISLLKGYIYQFKF